MSDTALNKIIQYGTTAQRTAFTPTPAAGSQVLYIWYDTTLTSLFIWDGSAWVLITGSGGTGGGSAALYWKYRAKTTATSGYPGDGYILWDNATQISATHLIFAHITSDGVDIDLLLGLLLASGDTLLIQDEDASANFQKWTISGAPVNTNPGLANSYWTIPVTLVSSGGTGTTGFLNNHAIVSFLVPATAVSAITSLTGDVTATGPGAAAATIANLAITTAKINTKAVTNAKLDDMATQTFKGRTTAGTGVPEDLTATQATAILNNLVGDSGAGGTKGLAPAPAAGDSAAGKFLKADGNWAVPSGTGVSVTGSPANGNLTKFSGASSITNGDLSGDATTSGTLAVTLASQFKKRQITVNIGDGVNVISTGIAGDISVPVGCTITKVRMLADQSGSIVVDIWKDTYANYPPTVADTITASAKPTISAATKSEDSTLTGWTTSITAGDTLRFNVDSVATITRLALSLEVTVN